MRTKIVSLLAVAFSLGVVQAASAADMPTKGPVYKGPAPVVAYDWSGIYVGGQVGGGWSHTTVTNVAGIHFFNFIGDSRSMDDSAFLGGLFVGAQQQFGSFVIGVEGGSAWGSLSQTIQARGPFFAADNYNAKILDLYSVAGRLGYAFDRVLVYGKAGWATASVSTQSDEVPAFNHFGNSSARHNGYVVGVGIDYAWTPNLIAGIEYNYYDLRTKTHVGVDTLGPGFSAYDVDVHPKVSTVMARLSYKFGWPH